MRKEEKYVSQEDMWAKLAKHSSPKVEITPQAGEAPKEQLPALVWLEPVKTGRRSGYVLTACGAYSISKDASESSETYTAWRRGDPPTNLGCVMTKAEAEKLCEGAR